MGVREEVHQLVDELAESDLVAAKRLLDDLRIAPGLRDDALRAFLEACPEDDEATTPEDLAAIARGRDALAGGTLVPHAEVRRRARKSAA